MSEKNTLTSFYQNFSTETLESMLRDLTLSENELDMDQFDAIMAELDRREGAPETTPPEEALAQFRDVYSDSESGYLDCAHTEEHTEPSRRRAKRSPKRILILVAVLGLLFLMASVTYASIPDSPFVQWVDEVFSFSSLPPGEYSSLQNALDAYNIEEAVVPYWLPPRYSMECITITEEADSLSISCPYRNMNTSDDELTISISRSLSQESGLDENNIASAEPYEVSGITYYISNNEGESSILWTNGTCQCSITGVLSELEITTIIGSIREHATVQKSLEAYGVEETVVPTWLPDNFVLTQIIVSETEMFTNFNAIHVDFDHPYRNLVMKFVDNTSITKTIYEKDNTPVETYTVGDQEYYIFSNFDDTTIAWTTNHFECSISGILEEDEIYKIIDSIQ